MNSEEVKERFEKITNNSTYIRVNNTHPLELYLGKNQNGNLTLRYNGKFKPIKIISNKLLEIKQVSTNDYNSLLFSYNSNESITLFYKFCSDIINLTEKYNGEDGYKEIVNRYIRWKKMFSNNSKLLNENEIIGLIGELLFLKDNIFKVYGINKGLCGWSGPEPTHKDFSIGNDWYEVKTISSSKNTINISSIEQLDGNTNGKLIVYSLEKMSPNFNGITLNNLVNEIESLIMFDSDVDLFHEKLINVGYGYYIEYDEFVYNISSKSTYLVDEHFPIIKRETLPNSIGKVQYEILLSMIDNFRE